jgi:antirestriction protein ArdC
MNRDVYQSVTDSIVSLLERGAAPWRKPWNDSNAVSAAMPFNAVTGRHYSGINVPLLWGDAQEKGYPTNGYVTYCQAQERGGFVRKGEHGRMVIFWKFQDVTERKPDGTEEQRTVPFARAYTVFNVAQVSNIGETKAGEILQPVEPDNVISWCESVGVPVRHGGNRAYYVPSLDYITLPRPEQFRSVASYHATALHELTHATGHESRLNRRFGARFGDEAYAFEELCAELGSAFLCASIGIENAPLEDHASYLDHWLKILKNDKRAIFTAASQAQKACDYCLEHGQRERLAA